RTETFDGKPYNQFLGIPYAEPPIGDLRFKKPVPIKAWSELREASQWPNPCYQHNPDFLDNFRNKQFSEDCLYLNIWAPVGISVEAMDKNQPKAVMVWIHGGALIVGSPVEDYYSGHVLATKGDVVVVTIGYRTSTFGFLYTGTDDAPGNMGLWDQVLALQWVNDNIELFGGDSHRVTVFGESAGGWSTSLHILSPISRPLFQNAIMMSGAAINRNAGEPARDVMQKWLRGAQAINCTEGDDIPEEFTPKIIDCLHNTPAETLAAIPILPALMEGIVGWNTVVIIDGEFLPARPLEMLSKGDHKKGINLMVGTAQDEGSWILWLTEDSVKYSQHSPSPMTHMEAYNELSRISRKMWSKEPIDGEMVSKVYFTGLSDKTPQDILRQTIGVAIGDYLLGCPAIQFAKTLYENDVSDSRVYQYYYNSKLGEPKQLCSKWSGVCHFDDVYPERDLSEKMIHIFSTFAKTGEPPALDGADWKAYYRLDNHTIRPYYEFTNQPKPVTNFGTGLKVVECEYLWKKYIDQQ
ncbi:unnamed protein product, partial [Oppiella nova]